MTPRDSLLATMLLGLPALAYAQTDPVEATWDLRLRHELVEDGAFARDARADTLRLRAGLRFAFGDGWMALLEGEGVANAGDQYNSGANGRTQYPAVIDPEGAELNQAWLGWQGTRLAVTAGRQRILLDNQRWVGNVGWRQNEQTFDAITTQWSPSDAITVKFDWLAGVQRINGDRAIDPLASDRRLDTQLLNVAYKRGKQQWTGYAYLHRDKDLAAASSETIGLRWSGDLVQNARGWSWSVETARQRDHGNSPLDYSHAYWLVEPAYSVQGTTFKLGWEHLGGDGRHALQTPLATLHAFDGWADKFAVTPGPGLEDRYVWVGGKFGHVGDGKFGWAAAYHDFGPDKKTPGLGDYGREWDASLAFPLAKGVQALVKLADYRSQGYARDTTKVWLQLEWVGTN